MKHLHRAWVWVFLPSAFFLLCTDALNVRARCSGNRKYLHIRMGPREGRFYNLEDRESSLTRGF